MGVELLNKYSLLYFVTVQTLYVPEMLSGKYLKWIPLAVHSVITCVCFHILLKSQIFFNLITLNWLLHFLRLTAALPSVSTIVYNIIMSKVVQNIPKLLLDVKSDMEIQFGAVFSYGEFIRRHNRKIVIFSCNIVINAICRAAVPTVLYKRSTDASIVTMNFFCDAFVLYFLFQIDLLYSLLRFMNANLNRISKTKKINNIQRFNMFKFITCLHRRIWRMKSVIENRFGWILMIVFLKYFLHVLVNVHWFLRLLIDHKQIAVQLMRKYIFFLFI